MKLRRYQLFSVLLAAPFAAVLASQTSLAQSTYYWDNNGGTAIFGTATGTWATPTTGNST